MALKKAGRVTDRSSHAPNPTPTARPRVAAPRNSSYLRPPHAAALPDDKELLRRRRHRRPHAPVPRLRPRRRRGRTSGRHGGQRPLLVGEAAAAPLLRVPPLFILVVVPRVADLKVNLLDGRRRHGHGGQHRFGVGAVGPARPTTIDRKGVFVMFAIRSRLQAG